MNKDNAMIEKHIQEPLENLFSHDPSLDFSNAPIKWRDNSAVKSFWDNALSIAVPVIEAFGVDAMEQLKKEKLTPYKKLQDDINDFCEQESRHSDKHAAFNDYLKLQGIDVEKYQSMVKKKLLNNYEGYSLPEKLELTAFVECFVYCMSQNFLVNSMNESSNNSVNDLWVWHTIEEVEHRSVAFDVYKFYTQRQRPDFLKLTKFALKFGWLIGIIFLDTLYKKKLLFKFKTFKDFFWLIGINGPLFSILRGYFHFLTKNYDPRTLHNPTENKLLFNIIKTWEEKYHTR